MGTLPGHLEMPEARVQVRLARNPVRPPACCGPSACGAGTEGNLSAHREPHGAVQGIVARDNVQQGHGLKSLQPVLVGLVDAQQQPWETPGASLCFPGISLQVLDLCLALSKCELKAMSAHWERLHNDS